MRPERSVAETTAFLSRASKSPFLALWRVGDRFANSLAIRDNPFANLPISFPFLPFHTISLSVSSLSKLNYINSFSVIKLETPSIRTSPP